VAPAESQPASDRAAAPLEWERAVWVPPLAAGKTAPGGPGPQIDPVLRSIVQQLTDDELDTVRELVREGFTAGDAVQIFLISDKDVDKTRATLLSMK
jgi:hypothetical protein